MGCAGYANVWDLGANELVKLDDGRGTTLRVTRGKLWITFEHDTRDVVLAAGDAFTVDRDGLTLIEAQSATIVCTSARDLAALRLGSEPKLFMRVRRWLRGVAGRAGIRRWAASS